MPSILRAQGFGQIAAFASTTLMNALGIVGVVVAVLIVDRIGRKRVIAAGGPLCALTLVIFSLVLGSAGGAVAAICAFGFFSLIVIPVMDAYVSELYPTELRASGFGWASSASRALTGFAPLLFGSALAGPRLGLPLTFTLLGALLTGTVAFMIFGAPETRGRELDRIVEDAPPPSEADTVTVPASPRRSG